MEKLNDSSDQPLKSWKDFAEDSFRGRLDRLPGNIYRLTTDLLKFGISEVQQGIRDRSVPRTIMGAAGSLATLPFAVVMLEGGLIASTVSILTGINTMSTNNKR